MSEKHDYYINRWQRLIEKYQGSGMKLTDWCAANGVTHHQYYYWLSKVRSECYEAAVKQLQTTETNISATVPTQVQTGSFVEIKPEVVGEALDQASLNLPAAVIQKGSIRIEIMPNASASFISQLLSAVQYV